MIDKQMRDDYWTHDEEGLLFLLENNNHFVKLYDKEDVAVYRYISDR